MPSIATHGPSIADIRAKALAQDRARERLEVCLEIVKDEVAVDLATAAGVLGLNHRHLARAVRDPSHPLSELGEVVFDANRGKGRPAWRVNLSEVVAYKKRCPRIRKARRPSEGARGARVTSSDHEFAEGLASATHERLGPVTTNRAGGTAGKQSPPTPNSIVPGSYSLPPTRGKAAPASSKGVRCG